MTLSLKGRMFDLRDVGPEYYLVAASDAPLWVKRLAGVKFVCDGINDEEQIENAIALSDGVVHLSEGTYTLWDEIDGASGVALQGSGKYATTITQRNSGALGRLIDARGLSNIGFYDLTLDGNYANQTTYGHLLDISNNGTTTTNVDICGVRFRNNGANGENERAVHGTGTSPYLSRVRVHECDVEDCTTGIILAGSSISVTNCRVYKVSRANAGWSGIFVTTGTGGLVQGNDVRDTTISCLDFGTMTGLSIANNYFQPFNGGIGMQADGIIRDVSITGNTLENQTTPTGAAGGYGILFTGGPIATATGAGSKNIVVRGNTLRRFDSCIYFYGANSDVLIEGNVIEEWSNTAIRARQQHSNQEFTGGPTHIKIRGNHLNQNIAAGSGSTFGIRLNSVTHCVIRGNSIRSAAALSMAISEVQDESTDLIAGQANANNTIEGNDLRGVAGANIISSVVATTRVRYNPGYATENQGTFSINSGATTAVFAHGLVAAPTQVAYTFKEQGTNDYGRTSWSADGTNITITVAADPGASNLDGSWYAEVR